MQKKFFTLALAAVAAAMFVVPATASAASGSCAFQGVAGNISPGVMLQGGGGVYDFATPAGSSTTLCEMNGSGLQASTIKSVGQFDNIVCGTGTAWSGYNDRGPTADLTEINAGGGTAEITSASYTIDFVGAQGRLDIHTVNGSPESAGADDVDGHVTIIPRTGSCTAATGVTAFEVVGALHADW